MGPLRLVSIVDDDESARLAIESLVRSLGWHTRTFASADEYLQALPHAARDATACLISDIRMPGLSGLELRERLMALGIAPPTIFVTAFPTDVLRAQVAASGALVLLAKPLDAAVLARHLANAIGEP